MAPECQPVRARTVCPTLTPKTRRDPNRLPGSIFNNTRTYDTTAFAELLKTQQLKREVRKRKRAGGGTAGQPSQPDRQPDKSPGLQPLDAGSEVNASITDVVDDGEVGWWPGPTSRRRAADRV